MFRHVLILTVIAGVSSIALAEPTATSAEELAELRADFAKLKLQHDQTMAELRELKAAMNNQSVTDEADTEPAPRPQLTESEAAALLQRIADHQSKLEAQVDTLIDRQRELESQANTPQQPSTQAPAPAPTVQSYTQTIESPYAYRYERTEERIVRNPAAESDKPVIVSPKYTVYSNGYSTDSYVLPTTPRRTVAQPVYVNNNHFYHRTVYPNYRNVYRTHRHYPVHHYPTYHKRHHRSSSGLTVGVYDGKTFFRYSTGGTFGRYYCR